MDRILGVETEFGCLVDEDAFPNPESAVEAIKNHIFEKMRLGLIDLHARDDIFEPALAGGFLVNGGRLYVDAVGSHLEYATAECRSLHDLIANDRAGQRIILQAIEELGLSQQVRIYNNSVDHYGGHTFGCHENYLVRMEEDFFTSRMERFYPFLVTRQLFAGVGRVGGHCLSSSFMRPTHQDVSEHPTDYIWVSQIYSVQPDDSVEYQLSQRADHILKTIASRVRFNRALVNPKWEQYYSHDRMQRLHLLFGEPNQSQYAYALKIGTTSLVLRLIEDGLIPEELQLFDPISALKEISRDSTHEWLVTMQDNSTINAIDLQRRYLELASCFRGSDRETDWVLREWEYVLNHLEKDPMALVGRLDWVTKLFILREYMESESIGWEADALHSIDLEYHNIDPNQSLYYAYRECHGDVNFVDELDTITSMVEPPKNTRACARGAIICNLLREAIKPQYFIDWNGVMVDDIQLIDLSDPFNAGA